MRLLVSVATASEALAALEGGADLIDAKDPLAGALGAVSHETFREISAAVAGRRPVTAALSDATDAAAIERAAEAFGAMGASFVKVGFASITSREKVAALVAAAVRGTSTTSVGRNAGVVAVAYADANRSTSLERGSLLDVAARTGAAGVLLDTADKAGRGLRELVALRALAAWVSAAHEMGLLVALAGKLRADDIPFARDTRADIVGVRGAACDGGRTGRISIDRVRQLRALCDHVAHTSAIERAVKNP